MYALSKHASTYDELDAELRQYTHWKVKRVSLSAEELRAKRQAFDSFRTQVDGLLAGIPDLLEPAVLGAEIYCDPSGSEEILNRLV